MVQDSLRAELTALTSELVRFASTASRPDQIHAACDFVAAYAATIPGLFIHRVEQNGVPSVVATLRDTRTPAVFLNGHVDVVAAEPHQFIPELRGDRLYGRATQDMKGSVAVLMRLMKDLAALDNPPDVGFQFVGDEEIGGYNSTGFLLEQGWRCGFFIAAEPTDLAICYAQKGLAWIELVIPGRAAHGSRPWDGENPLLALSQGLLTLQERYPNPTAPAWRTTIVPSVVDTGGNPRNQIPAAATLALDVRCVPTDDIDLVVRQVVDCFPTAIVKLARTTPSMNTDPDHPLVRQLAVAAEGVMGRTTSLYREHFASDARFYSVAGIPAVCFGPVGAGLHSADEWVDVGSLAQLYTILRTFVA